MVSLAADSTKLTVNCLCLLLVACGAPPSTTMTALNYGVQWTVGKPPREHREDTNNISQGHNLSSGCCFTGFVSLRLPVGLLGLDTRAGRRYHTANCY